MKTSTSCWGTLLGVTLVFLGLAWQSARAAETYPARTIRLVVPFPGGGATDATARLFAQLISAQLGQTIVVENKTGATGSISAI